MPIDISGNRQRPCSVSTCRRLRYNYSLYCQMHAERKRDYGHPLQTCIRKRTLKPYRRLAKKFMRQHQSHPSTLAALDILQSLITPAAVPPRKHGRTVSALVNEPRFAWLELKRLADSTPPVSPTEALEAALSIALLAEWEPRTFHDGKALRFAMARAIYALRDFWAGSQWDEETQKVKRVSVRKPGSLALNWLGERLQRKLGLWFANATTLIINEIDSQQQRARDLASLIPVSASN